MTTVAIIGGGITGLTAAFRLKRAGVPVTIYEAGTRVGGVIQSIRKEGYLAEGGPNSILETSPKISALVRDLGLEQRKIYSDPKAEKRFILRNGKPTEVPGSPLKFVASELFSARAKTRLLAEPFIRRTPSGREESVAQFVRRRLGQEFLDYAINPMVAGVYAGNPERLSVTHAFPKLLALEQRYGSLLLGQFLGARERKKRAEISKQSAKKFSFDAGLETLIDALHHELGGDIQLQCAVTKLEQTASGWRVFSTDGPREHSSILLTAPAYKLARIEFQSRSGFQFSDLREINYPPVVSAVLGFRREDVAHALDGFGVLVPEEEQRNILGAIFSSSLFPNRAPDGHVTITCYLGGCRNPALAQLEKPALRRLILEDLETILGVSGQPTFEHYSVFPQAIPQYNVGYGRFKTLMNQIESSSPGLFFAGHYRDGISLGDSIVSGENAAEKIAKFCPEPSPHSPVPQTLTA